MQILRTIKAWYGRGNSAWDGSNGLDQDLVHIDNHLPNITFTGAIVAGNAATATPAALPGVAQLFSDGSYAVTGRNASGNLAAYAYPAKIGAMASNGAAILINTGTAWINLFSSITAGSIPLSALANGALTAGIALAAAQVIGTVSNAQYATTAGNAATANNANAAATAASADAMSVLVNVPVTNVGASIVVSAPHLRAMVWNGTAYIRAPWHQPGMIRHSVDNPTSIPGHLPVRADVVYAQANYPDLVTRLGLSGVGNFSLIELRGEFIRCLDNGRAIDTSRVNASAQAEMIGSHVHDSAWALTSSEAAGYGLGLSSNFQNRAAISSNAGLGRSTWTNSGTENRPRNVALPAWVSY